ncbi:MAG: hypothetical protein OEV40_22320 [Acidimicrobiia bacterium]|nr:hypothetical protein [Acidimicrobiia bacterium]
MTWKDQIPGEFPDISKREEYQRLVALAKRRLVGFEHHAEDVVSQAMMKWARISTDRRGVARLEQVIKSEAYSFIRSERRARDRDSRVYADRSSPIAGHARPHTDQDTVLMRRALAETCRQEGISLNARDIEVLELLLAGFSLSDIVRRTGFTRHQVKSSRRKWQDILRKTLAEPAAERRPAPQK